MNKFALSAEQLTEAVAAYLKEHNHRLEPGPVEVDICAPFGDIKLSFEVALEKKTEKK